MAEPALAYPPRPGPALDAILALHEDSLPYTDDQPLVDGSEQRRHLDYSRDAIGRHLRGVYEPVAVDGNMYVHYIGRDDRGEPVRRSVAPDVFAVFGRPDRPDRRSYVLWDEPEADMRFVLEIASTSTRARDHGAKRDIYASLGVREYFLYDPPWSWRPAALVGLRLRDGVYREIPPRALSDGRPGVPSDVLGLVGHVGEGGRLRWFDPTAGENLRDFDEHADLGDATQQCADAAEQWADALEQCVDATERWADALEQRADAAERRIAEQRANAAKQRARAAEQRARGAEQRLAELKALLRKL